MIPAQVFIIALRKLSKKVIALNVDSAAVNTGVHHGVVVLMK